MRNFAHDLKGPIVNLKGLHEEIKEALNQIRSQLELYQGSATDEAHRQIIKTLDDDAITCLEFAIQSTQTLEQTVADYQSYSSVQKI